MAVEPGLQKGAPAMALDCIAIEMVIREMKSAGRIPGRIWFSFAGILSEGLMS